MKYGCSIRREGHGVNVPVFRPGMALLHCDERHIFLSAWPSIEPFDFLHGDIFINFLKAPHGVPLIVG